MTLMFSRKKLPKGLTPEHIFRALQGCESAVFWLDSGITASSGKSYLGVSDEVVTAVAGSERAFLAQLRHGIDAPASTDSLKPGVHPHGNPEFRLGWVGWFSYEFGQALLEIPTNYREDIPPAVMMRVRAAVEVNHETGAIELIGESEEATEKWMDEFHSVLEASVAQPPLAADPAKQSASAIRASWRETSQEYLGRIQACQDAIERGDAYILCLTSQLEVDASEPLPQLYERLRKLNPTHHGGYLSAAGVTLLSASPEQFLSVNTTGLAQTKPIKGTRPRDTDRLRDQALATELASDEKELAENLMIVDLMRNDFSTVCDPASVRVPKLHVVESYENVHQLVSTVTGQLTRDHDAFDLFAACFPAGSMTGTPKHSAVSILSDIEGEPRGLYSGCFGYFSQDGCADLAMVIRSIVVTECGMSIGSGGGITSDSNPTSEVAEVELKARGLLAALGSDTSPVM